jgi:hypothetical protein
MRTMPRRRQIGSSLAKPDGAGRGRACLQGIPYSLVPLLVFLTCVLAVTACGRIVHLEEIVAMDPTVAEVADMPLGWVAFRSVVGGKWTREPQE